jgi:multidrug resistance protein
MTNSTFRTLKNENRQISTYLAFMLIPLSGFAMDIFIPSFPDMVKDLHTSANQVRLTLTVFMVSYGVSQLFVGNIVDRYGRYRLCLWALAVFAASNILIVTANGIPFILAIRAIQGLTIAMIVVAKRSFFVDVYEGEQRKHYISLLSIVWSAAPILAPFLGGYLQEMAGWRANFYFLAIYALLIFLLEWRFSGETIEQLSPLDFKSIINNYHKFLTTKDFITGVVILGLSYSMSIIFAMSAPFIIENRFHYPAVNIGYSALVSGVAMLCGGLTSKRLLHKKMFPKLYMAIFFQMGLALLMYSGLVLPNSIFGMMMFVFLIHCLTGFIYNIYLTYCLTRFSKNIAAAGGFTSGGSYIVTSVISLSVVNIIYVDKPQALAICYFMVAILILGGLMSARKA